MRRSGTLILAGLAAALLAACSQHPPAMRVEVSGGPEEVSRFVEAEKANAPTLQVTHTPGSPEAVFVVEPDDGHALASRAIEARLNTQVRTGPGEARTPEKKSPV